MTLWARVLRDIRGVFSSRRTQQAAWRDAWLEREEARQIQEVRDRLQRVQEQLTAIDRRRAQRG